MFTTDRHLPFTEPNQFSPCPPPYFLRIHFNIILPSKSRSSKWSSFLQFLHQITVRTSPSPLRFKTRGREIFWTHPDRLWGSTHPIQWERGSFPGVKWPGHEADQSPRSSAEVKTRLELYNYMFSWRREQQLFYFYSYFIIFQLFCSSYTRFIYFILKLRRCNIKICKTALGAGTRYRNM